MGILSKWRMAIFEYLLPWKDIKYDWTFSPSHSQYSKNTIEVFSKNIMEQIHNGRVSSTVPALELWDSTYLQILTINPRCISTRSNIPALPPPLLSSRPRTLHHRPTTSPNPELLIQHNLPRKNVAILVAREQRSRA